MITAAMHGGQARKLNYVEVEIVPKPSNGNGDKSVMLMADRGVKYSTIIFPERDGNGTPRNSIGELDPFQSSGGHLSSKEYDGPPPPDRPKKSERGEGKNPSQSIPPQRRRAHSSPTHNDQKVSLPPVKCEQVEEFNSDQGKSRTLPTSDPPWPDGRAKRCEPEPSRREENPIRALVAVEKPERVKQETAARKVKKFFRSGRHVSDLGKTQDIVQAVQAAQKKAIRRKSSGESVDSGNDPGYPSDGQGLANDPTEFGQPTGPHEGYILSDTARTPPPIPGSVRNTELEKAMTRLKLSRQSSVDKTKTASAGPDDKEAEYKNRTTKLRNMLPTMRFGKFGSSLSKSKELAKQEELKNQQCKKPVPLPRYQRGQLGYDASFDDGYNEPGVSHDNEEPANLEGDMYVNVVFKPKPPTGGRHNYENISVEDNVPSEPQNVRHATAHKEPDHHQLRPMPAPRSNAPSHSPQKISPQEKPPCRKTSYEYGYETVSFKPPCLKVVEAESFFPQHVGSSFEEEEGAFYSSCEEDVKPQARNQEVEHLINTLKKDAVLSSRELKRGFGNVVFKRNSDGSVRSMPEQGWNGDHQYAVIRKKGEEPANPGRCAHQKHNRSHSSGGQRAPIYAGVNKTHVSRGEKEPDVHSSEMFRNQKGDAYRTKAQNSPPRQKREKRTLRYTHEHVTLGHHVHSTMHSQALLIPSLGLHKATGLHKPNTLHVSDGQQDSNLVDEIKSRYKEELSPRTPPLGSPHLDPQTPWWEDDAEEEQLEEKPIHSYINQPWYYGKLLRQECDYLMLSKGKPCQYLVRDSSHRAGGLMLCVLYAQKVHHYIIQVISETEYLMANHTFGSISEIIEFYRKHIIMYSPNQEPVFLGEPFLYPR